MNEPFDIHELLKQLSARASEYVDTVFIIATKVHDDGSPLRTIEKPEGVSEFTKAQKNRVVSTISDFMAHF